MSNSLRVVTWNCCEAIRFKLEELRRLLPDVAVVLECSINESFDEVFPEMRPSSVLWVNSGTDKKIGVFGFGDYNVTLDSCWDESITHIAPVQVTGPVSFHLLAVYALHENKPGETKKHIVGPLLRAIDKYRDFISEQPTVVAGDFNNNLRWDAAGKGNNHANVVEALGNLGLVSAYHTAHGAQPGSETHPTFFHRKKIKDAYHIDYCFVPKLWTLVNCAVGNAEDWLGFSDHMPPDR